MRIYLILISTLLITPAIASARLGEYQKDNQARYGNAVKENFTVSPLLRSALNEAYHYQGWKIQVGYMNGRAVRIAYSKLPQKNVSPQLKDDEIAAVLEAESHGGQWKQLKPASLFSVKNSGNKTFDHAQLRWSNNNKCIAYCPLGRMIVYIESPEAVMWEQSIENEKEVKRKENIPRF